MKQTFEVKNVKCTACASTLKKSLLEDFGDPKSSDQFFNAKNIK